ncbi:MAG: IS1 family transposase [Lachnospiraceae bacterium]|nr:IS1 family transposase [Lachnospiraceae bacterium]
MKNSYDVFYAKIKNLSSEQLQTLSEVVALELGISSVDETAPDTPLSACKRCGSKRISKHGKDRKGNQRYHCKFCGKFFSGKSFSVISYSHYDISLWKKYIDCFLRGYSLEKCGQICGISTRTAFFLRHKILPVVFKVEFQNKLDEIVNS